MIVSQRRPRWHDSCPELTGEPGAVHPALAMRSSPTATVNPDVVLRDTGLPKLTGYEAARRLREQPWSQKRVLVALIVSGQRKHRLKCREAEFDGDMAKLLDVGVFMKPLVELLLAPFWSLLRWPGAESSIELGFPHAIEMGVQSS